MNGSSALLVTRGDRLAGDDVGVACVQPDTDVVADHHRWGTRRSVHDGVGFRLVDVGARAVVGGVQLVTPRRGDEWALGVAVVVVRHIPFLDVGCQLGQLSRAGSRLSAVRIPELDQLITDLLVDDDHPEIVRVEMTATQDPLHHNRLVVHFANGAAAYVMVARVERSGIPRHTPHELPREAVST